MIKFEDNISVFLAESLKNEVLKGKIKNGQRVLVKNYHHSILINAADKLASLCSEVELAQKLKRKNVVYVRANNEAERIAELQKKYLSRQSCSSYCVNIRDGGETAIFFVPKSVDVYLDESLGVKGSIDASNIRGLSQKRVIINTIKHILESLRVNAERSGNIVQLIWNRIEKLLGVTDQKELLAYELIGQYLSLNNFEKESDALHCKELALIPFSVEAEEFVAEDKKLINNNLDEIEKLRQAMIDLKMKKKYSLVRENYDSEKWALLNAHLKKYNYNIPLENDIKAFCKFFKDWPVRCDLPFIQCKPGQARICLKLCYSHDEKRELPYGPDARTQIINTDSFKATWHKISKVLLSHCACLKIGNYKKIAVPFNELKFDIDATVLNNFPIGEVQKIMLSPEQDSGHKLHDTIGNVREVIRLDEIGFQILMDVGEQLIWINSQVQDIDITVRADTEIKFKNQYFNGFKQIAETDLKILSEEEEVDSIKLSCGEEITLKVICTNPEKINQKMIITASGENEEPQGLKRIDSFVDVLIDARSDDRFNLPPVNLQLTTATWPRIEVTCDDDLEWQKSYEARESWVWDLIDYTLQNPQNSFPQAITINKEKLKISDKPLNTSDGQTWNYDKSVFTEEFKDAKRKLYETLGNRNETLPFVDLSLYEDLIASYIKEYQKILNKFISSERYSNKHSLMSALDTFMIVNTNDHFESGRFPDELLDSCLYLVSPCHPIRLLWLMKRQELIKKFARDSTPNILRVVNGVLDGIGYPNMIVRPDGTVLKNIMNTADRFLGLFVPESMSPEKILSLLSEFSSILAISKYDENPALPDAGKISTAIEYVHRMLPYRRELKILYQNADDCANLVEALEDINPSTEVSSQLHKHNFNKDRISPIIYLPRTDSLTLGGAFIKHKNESNKIPESTEVIIVSQDTLNSDELSDFDICFTDTDSNIKLDKTIRLDMCPKVLPFDGLVCPRIRRGTFCEDGTGRTLFSWVHPCPENENLSEFSSLNYSYQTLFRDPSEDKQLDKFSARAYETICDQQFCSDIDRFHSKSTFLFSLDSGSDISFFDNNAASKKENLIIDFDVDYYNPIATATSKLLRKKKPHNYIITTRKGDILQKRIIATLRRLLEDNISPDDLTAFAKQIIYSLNGLSGKYLREILQGVNDIKEAVACALTLLFLHRINSNLLSNPLNKNRSMASIIVPIDDHWFHWRRLISDNIKEDSIDVHADLMWITIIENTVDDVIEIWPKIIEAKYRTKADDAKDAIKKYYNQVQNTWELFCKWLDLEPSNNQPDSDYCEYHSSSNVNRYVKCLDLSSLLEFYLWRSMRLFPDLIQENIKNEENFRSFVNKVVTKIYTGNYRICFDVESFGEKNEDSLSSGVDVKAGNIIVWGPYESELYTEEVGLRPKALGKVFNGTVATELLRETCE